MLILVYAGIVIKIHSGEFQHEDGQERFGSPGFRQRRKNPIPEPTLISEE
jgi:hypothetical protein